MIGYEIITDNGSIVYVQGRL